MSTRFYSGQKDYIVQLNLMDDSYGVAIASVTGKANRAGDTFTGRVSVTNGGAGIPSIAFDQTGDNPYIEWQRWMGAATNYQGFRQKVGTATMWWESSTQVDKASQVFSTVMTLTNNGNLTVTGSITANTFVGALSGTATNATNVTVTNDVTTNATYFPTFVTATGGNTGVKLSNSKLTFNPSTGALSATSFVGALTGTASIASTIAVITDDTTNAANYLWFGTGSAASVTGRNSSKLTFNPSTGTLTATGLTTTGAVSIGGTLTVNGNLVVNGTTTTVNATTTTYDDPVITLGGDVAPTVDDNKDRGVEFRWHNGIAAKTGFFGFDDSTGRWTFIPDGTNTGEVYSGAVGTLEANLQGNVTGNVTGNVSGTAANVTGVVAVANGGTGATTAAGAATNLNVPQYASMQGGRSYVAHDFSTYVNLYETKFVNISLSTNAPAGFTGNGYLFGMGAGDTALRGFELLGNANQLLFRDRGNGTWFTTYHSGNTVAVANGGTGITSYAAGDIVYATGATALAKLAAAAAGNVLISGTSPAWGKVGLTTHVSGTLPIANGGTNGTATPTAGAISYGTGTAFAFTAAGTAGQILKSAGAGVPVWDSVTNVIGYTPANKAGDTFTGNVVVQGTVDLANGTGPTTATIAGGATASGQTATVNIGTGGLAGSTTNITFGPTAGTVTYTFNGSSGIKLPTGNTASRPAASAGLIRFNNEIGQFEGNNGTAWGSIGGGAKGGGSDQVFYENDQVVNNDYAITAGKNASTTGPLTIASGKTVTVPTGSRLVIL